MVGHIQISIESLKELAHEAVAKLECCEICPRRCGVNRLQDERGFCRTGRRARVASYSPHFGEEPPLVGRSGSGTIFFSGCNLSCVFCQNYDISQQDAGPGGLAEDAGAHDAAPCRTAAATTSTSSRPRTSSRRSWRRWSWPEEEGLHVPLVYNSGGYDSVETLRLLDGIFDIYMPDAKYGSDEPALKYSNAPDYTAHHEGGHPGDAPPGGRSGHG